MFSHFSTTDTELACLNCSNEGNYSLLHFGAKQNITLSFRVWYLEEKVFRFTLWYQAELCCEFYTSVLGRMKYYRLTLWCQTKICVYIHTLVLGRSKLCDLHLCTLQKGIFQIYTLLLDKIGGLFYTSLLGRSNHLVPHSYVHALGSYIYNSLLERTIYFSVWYQKEQT